MAIQLRDFVSAIVPVIPDAAVFTYEAHDGGGISLGIDYKQRRVEYRDTPDENWLVIHGGTPVALAWGKTPSALRFDNWGKGHLVCVNHVGLLTLHSVITHLDEVVELVTPRTDLP